ncbi:hypothetical protein [Dokdonia sp. R86516]|uniref:hypothetical protein n=1 Tax=Dokdonia sp. R86516 TaxID=3093856 RepID=UPI0037CB9D84
MRIFLTTILILISNYGFSQSYDYDKAEKAQDKIYRGTNLKTGKLFFQDIYGTTAIVTYPGGNPETIPVSVIKSNIKVLNEVKADWNNPIDGDIIVITNYYKDFKRICNDDSRYCNSMDNYHKDKIINAEGYWNQMYAAWNKLLTSNQNITNDEDSENYSNNTSNTNSKTDNSDNATSNESNDTNSTDFSVKESPAEKAARLDRERGAEIMQETQGRVASVKTSSQQLGNAVSQISNSIVSGLQERDRRKAIESEKKERAYQNAVAKRDNDIAAIAKKQSLITDEKMASLKKAEFANWNSYKLSQNINNLINLRSLTLRNYKSKSLPKDIEKLVNLESLTLDLYSTGDLTSDLLNGGSFTLNSEIKELSNLNDITFIGNGYLTNINVDSSVFDELDNLETFSVYSKYLKSLPPSLLDSEYVEKIELYYHPKNRKNANNDQLKKDLKYIKSKTCLVLKFQDGTKPIFGKKCD